MKIGYARSYTILHNLDLQEDSLEKFGCEKVFTDHMGGAKSNRPGLETAIEFVRSGDTLVVWRLDRLGRNMEDLITIVNRLNNRGVSFHSLQENITMDKSSSTGQLSASSRIEQLTPINFEHFRSQTCSDDVSFGS